MKKLITITEALAELKTVDGKINTCKAFLSNYIVRQGTTIDPLDDDGGSPNAIAKKMQSLTDLLNRKVVIRTAINNKNAETKVSIGEVTKTVAEWIIWRREVFKRERDTYQALLNKVLDARKQCVQKGLTMKDDGTQPATVQEVSSFVPESKLNNHIEWLNEVETTLDGKLSLVNATTTVEV